jgi:ribosome biogenesis protein BRX1
MIGKEFISPSAVRSALRREQGSKYNKRKDAEVESTRRKEMRKREEGDLTVAKVFA